VDGPGPLFFDNIRKLVFFFKKGGFLLILFNLNVVLIKTCETENNFVSIRIFK